MSLENRQNVRVFHVKHAPFTDFEILNNTRFSEVCQIKVWVS